VRVIVAGPGLDELGLLDGDDDGEEEGDEDGVDDEDGDDEEGDDEDVDEDDDARALVGVELAGLVETDVA
jgi:hypothetical protein